MKTLVSALTGSLLLGAAVLATGAAAHSAEVIPALHDALPQAYRDNGIKIAAFNDWPPDEFVENGELKGWSIDMAKAMSERLGVPFEFTGTSFDAIIPGLVAKRFDAGFSSFGVTPERLESLDFVPQRMEGTAYAALATKAFEIDAEEDLCGHSIAVMTGAWDYQHLLEVSQAICVDAGKPAIDLQQFTSQNAAELAVSSGRVELVGAGSAKLMYLAKQTGKFKVSTLVSNPVQNGTGLRSGDPLGPILRDALQAMIDDGSYKTILETWGVGGNGLLTKAVLVTKTDPDPK